MLLRILFFILAPVSLLLATNVTFKLSEVPAKKKGVIYLVLCEKQKYYEIQERNKVKKPDKDAKPECLTYVKVTKVDEKKTDYLIKINGVKPGEYLISGFQDLNGNEKLDKSWIFIPKEPMFFIKKLELKKPNMEELMLKIEGKTQTIPLVTTEF